MEGEARSDAAGAECHKAQDKSQQGRVENLLGNHVYRTKGKGRENNGQAAMNHTPPKPISQTV